MSNSIDIEALKAIIPYEEYYRSHLGEIRSGKYFCPFHDDRKTPNLSADEKGYYCFAGCGGGDIFKFHGKFKGLPFADVLRELAEQYAPHLLSSNGNGNQNFPKKEVAKYDYRDESGKLLYQVVKYEPKDFMFRHPDGKGSWVWNLEGVRRVPYRLHDLLASSGTVHIPGGEKDCETLIKLGMTATTNPCGEGNWKPEFNEHLKGRKVVVFEDNDKPGRKHGQVVAKSLHGIAEAVKVIAFPELPEHGDVSDYLDTHSKEQLLQEIEKAPFYVPSSNNLLEKLETWNHLRESDIKVEWMVDCIIPKGSITVLFGKGGIGKTWLMMDIARCIGNGTDYLGHETKQASVIYIDFENPHSIMKTRAVRLGEAENVHFWWVGHEFKPPKLDLKEWEQYKELPEGAVLVFDTLRASQSGDENDSRSMAEVMNRMKELRDLGFTIILLHHTAKNAPNTSKGSTVIVDLADHVLGLTRVQQKGDGRDTVVDDGVEGFDTETVYYFGNYEKTRFEPHGINLKLNPDRGFELAPDPEEETLKKMHKVLKNSGPLQKTVFATECKALGFAEKKVRKLIDRGKGRFWKIEALGQKNAQLITAIQFGSSATPIESEKLPNCSEGVLEPEKQESFVPCSDIQ